MVEGGGGAYIMRGCESVVNLSRSASFEEIYRVYRKLARLSLESPRMEQWQHLGKTSSLKFFSSLFLQIMFVSRPWIRDSAHIHNLHP